MRRPAACAALLLSLAAPARAEELPPACGPAHDGVQVCMAQQVCTCGHDAGGTLAGRAPGWRWRCHIMQTCDMDAPATPPEAGGGGGAWPGPLYVTPNFSLPGTTAPATPPSTMPMPPMPRRP